MVRRSNVTSPSNVYILDGDFRTDHKFQSMVHGRKSLETMLRSLAGLDWVKGTVSLDRYTHLLTDLQRAEWEAGMYCSLLGDRDEIVWGLVKDGNGFRVACRCYKTDCRYFPDCRPDYVSGSVLPVSPDEIERQSRAPETEPLIVPFPVQPTTEELGYEEQDDRIERITIEPEPEIPVLEEQQLLSRDEQEAIITGTPNELTLVLAGPGTGKTYALLRKLEYMVDEKRMVEAGSILLLCFTRAAVREIRERFLTGVKAGKYSDDLSRLDIRTFDSFATLVLVAREIDCSSWDYDTRIEKVIDEINSDPDILRAMKHFIVDEIQDLVGVRARLVQTILKNRPVDCGFTLLGDHMQAIYDYNVRDVRGELNSRGFLQWLREEYGERLKEIKLTTNRRQTGKLAVFAARSRSLLETEDPERVHKFLDSLRAFPLEHEYSSVLVRGNTTDKVAILCRTNGEVLKVSGDLWKQHIAHGVRRQHSRWLLPAWLADVLGGERRRLTREDLTNAGGTGCAVPEDPDRLFDVFQRLGGTDGASVDAQRVRRALATDGRLPDELYEATSSALTVSTIHQSKGREYDRVYLLEPEGSDRADDPMEEARVYYVAATRARRDFGLLARPRRYTWLKTSPGGRWMELGRKSNGRDRLVCMEVGLETDIDEESFVDGRLPGFNPHERQEYIRKEIAPGDPLRLSLIDEDTGYYGIYHRDQFIGLMSRAFTQGVREVMNSVYVRRWYLPRGFSEVYVERVYSVIKKPETVSRNVPEPWMSTGIWYAVSLAGMGKVRFE